jgi:peptidoglycan/LPS O-acetylase OafA/YrhL
MTESVNVGERRGQRGPAQKLAGLEAIRGAAALYVVAHHAAALNGWTGPLKAVTAFGQEAVIVFFVLSGFVVALAQERTSQPEFAAYLRRRAVRIFPIYLLAIALAAGLAGSNPDPRVRTDVATLVGNLFQLQDISSLKPGVLVDVFGGNFPLWSLSYEWWFYLGFYALWRWRPDSLRDRDVAAAGALAVLVYAVIPNQIALFVAYFPIWWAGARLSHHYLRGEDRFRWSGLAPLAVVTGLWAAVVAVQFVGGEALSPGLYPVLPLRHAIGGGVAVLLALALCRRRPGWEATEVWLLTPLASLSYAIYVFHYPILASGLFAPLPPAVRLPVQLALILLLALLAERVVQPLLNRLFAVGPRAPAGARAR